MTIRIADGETVMFTGDSITDVWRMAPVDNPLGHGYPLFVVGRHGVRRPNSGITWLNSGVAGNRVVDLERRWVDEVLAPRPHVLSVLIGANDMWRRYDSDAPTSVEAFRSGYRGLLAQAVDAGVRDILLIEPFIVPVGEQQRWREDMDPKIQAVRELAREFDAHLLAADGMFAQLSATTGSEFWAEDGIHPTVAGHAALADAWLALVD